MVHSSSRSPKPIALPEMPTALIDRPADIATIHDEWSGDTTVDDACICTKEDIALPTQEELSQESERQRVRAKSARYWA